MTTLYIVEKSKKSNQGAAPALMGDFAVRAFASLNIVKVMTKVPGHAIPDIIIVDAEDIDEPWQSIIDFFQETLPQSGLIILHPAELIGERKCLEGEIKEKVYFFPKPLDSLILSQFVSKVARSLGTKTNVLRIGDFVFDFDRLHCRVLQDDLIVSLPLKEAQILKLMMEKWGECLSRSDIHRSLWPNVKVSPRTIDSHISRLRNRLKSMHVTIISKYGNGYVLDVT